MRTKLETLKQTYDDLKKRFDKARQNLANAKRKFEELGDKNNEITTLQAQMQNAPDNEKSALLLKLNQLDAQVQILKEAPPGDDISKEGISKLETNLQALKDQLDKAAAAYRWAFASEHKFAIAVAILGVLTAIGAALAVVFWPAVLSLLAADVVTVGSLSFAPFAFLTAIPFLALQASAVAAMTAVATWVLGLVSYGFGKVVSAIGNFLVESFKEPSDPQNRTVTIKDLKGEIEGLKEELSSVSQSLGVLSGQLSPNVMEQLAGVISNNLDKLGDNPTKEDIRRNVADGIVNFGQLFQKGAGRVKAGINPELNNDSSDDEHDSEKGSEVKEESVVML